MFKRWLKKLKQLFCNHAPFKNPVQGGYCTFGDAYWLKCTKCGKVLGTGIDKY